MALGGSTNAVLHLLAIAREAEVDLDPRRLQPHRRQGPAPRRPEAVRSLRHERRRQGRRHPGRDEGAARRRPDARRHPHRDRQDDAPRTSTRHRPAGARRRRPAAPRPADPRAPAGSPSSRARSPRGRGRQERRLRRLDVHRHRPRLRRRAGRARRARPSGGIVAGDVVVIRYEGPKGGPGMREMLAITGAIKGAGLGKDVLLITDGRFSGGTTGLCVGPHRPRGGRRRADRVRRRRRPDHPRRRQPHPRRRDRRAELADARRAGSRSPPKYTRGVLGKYAKVVQSAAHGAVCG